MGKPLSHPLFLPLLTQCRDISDANVLMQEADGLITSAKLVDWDKADIIPSDISEDDVS
jgi:hypothetical protein